MTDEALGETTATETTETVDRPDIKDQPLGEEVPVDVTGELDAEDFDFDAFVEGVRPGRRAVRVTMRADLVADLDRIAIKAEALADPNGDEAQELADEFDRIKDQIRDSQRVFVIEARSDERGKQILKHLEKLGHQKPGKKSTEEQIETWNMEAALHRLADAIVVPSRVSVDGLRRLNATAQSEFEKLLGALMEVSANPTKGITPPFSRRR